jgi:2-methylaconitate cis-trans-isomerase PrpF
MGLIDDISEAAGRQHTPKVAFVAPSANYTASSGKQIAASDIDLNVRALSMGLLHHAMMGTAAVAIATAAAIPGTLVNAGEPGGWWRRTQLGTFRPSLRYAESRRAGESTKRRLVGRQGDHEPQRARADGRLGAYPRRRILSGT